MTPWLRMGVVGMVMMGGTVEAETFTWQGKAIDCKMNERPIKCETGEPLPQAELTWTPGCLDDCKTRLVRDPCLARMEETMKAVDPWVGETSAHDTDKGEAYRKAKALWNTVKRDCWRKP